MVEQIKNTSLYVIIPFLKRHQGSQVRGSVTSLDDLTEEQAKQKDQKNE